MFGYVRLCVLCCIAALDVYDLDSDMAELVDTLIRLAANQDDEDTDDSSDEEVSHK